MKTDLLFWILLILISIELLAIYTISNAIKTILKSDYFKKKLKKFHATKNNEGLGKNIGALLIISFMTYAGSNALAQEVRLSNIEPPEAFLTQLELTNYILITISIVLAGIIVYLRKMMNRMMHIDRLEEEVSVQTSLNNSKFVRVLTDRVAEEDEDSIDLGHDYDGIRELDNNLPPWWKWGFYLSIVIALLYFTHYHILKTGDLQEAEYKAEMAQAELDIAQYLKDQAMNVDENTVTQLTDPADLDRGKTLFINYCAACHQDDAGGRVGPNLTDEYWLHGGKINDVFKTIKYGANNGMKSWKDELNPIQMQQIASFIKSLKGTTPASPKEAEGKLYVEEEEQVTNPE